MREDRAVPFDELIGATDMNTRNDPDLHAFDAVNRISSLANSLLAIAEDCDAVGMEKLADRIATKANAIIEEAASARRGMSLGLNNRTAESRNAVGETLSLLLQKSLAAQPST